MREMPGGTGGSRVLIAFVTTYGQTEKIARFIAERLTARGHTVLLRSCDRMEAGADVDLESFDGVMIGASVIRQRLQPAVRRLVCEHLEVLSERPSAFFQVSGAAGSRLESERDAARAIMNGFLQDVGWAPRLRASFGGAITYTRYPLLLKWIMKWICWRNGGSTDTSRDHEYTAWDEVATFADRFAELLETRRATTASSGTTSAGS